MLLWYNDITMAKSEDLQRHTQRVLTELGANGKPLSARAAGEKLGIGYNQIADMAKGKTPAEKTLIKFASAVGESPADWLHYAGKHDFAESWDRKRTPRRLKSKRWRSRSRTICPGFPKSAGPCCCVKFAR